jgi:glycosyltransferase involved in cell wall biosynthesis
VFIGDGELRGSLQADISGRGLRDFFIFTGWRNDIADCLAACDIFVMCSNNEGMGRAFVEAQAAGLPVVGTRVAGIPEVLVEGETGYLVNPGDADDLAEKLLTLYNSKDTLSTMSEKCRAWVNPRFSAEVMVKRIHEIYKEILVK